MVDSSAIVPVCVSIALLRSSVNLPTSVTKGAAFDFQAISNCTLYAFAILSKCSSSQPCSISFECSVLNLTLKIAVAVAGITFVTLDEVVKPVTSAVDGPK